jgi:hypothetical protein
MTSSSFFPILCCKTADENESGAEAGEEGTQIDAHHHNDLKQR